LSSARLQRNPVFGNAAASFPFSCPWTCAAELGTLRGRSDPASLRGSRPVLGRLHYIYARAA
jgi:hypothetical protein